MSYGMVVYLVALGLGLFVGYHTGWQRGWYASWLATMPRRPIRVPDCPAELVPLRDELVRRGKLNKRWDIN